jgi:acetate---CoA ligase (ADP-forming)
VNAGPRREGLAIAEPGQGLAVMLDARSIAVVGASGRPGSFGEQLMVQLHTGGYTGEVFPVNPSYGEVMGQPCFAHVGDLPQPVDLVILGVANARLEEQLRAAADANARSAVIFASTHEDPRPGVAPLRERLAAIAREAGMVICGSNGMGFLNVERGLRACGFTEPAGLEPGGICFLTHSGSVFSAMLHNDRGLRFNLVVSPGIELTTTMADYLHHALTLDSTRVVGLFLESARDPSNFVDALGAAAERDVPVVALKIGRAEESRTLVEAHSGALAGEDAAYDAVFDAFGVHRVETLDEMADTLELFQAGRRARAGGLVAIHDSGGERAHLVDMAATAGVPFARISEQTTRRLSEILEPGLPAVNPLDAWGTGNDSERIYVDCIRALADDDDAAAVAFVVDLTTQDPPEGGYVEVAKTMWPELGLPFAVLSNLGAAIDPNDARSIRSAGVPVLEGTRTALAAFRHLFDDRDDRTRPPVVDPEPVAPEVRARWRERLAAEEPLDEVDALALLSDYGIEVARSERAADPAGAVDAARRLGFPVAVKTSEIDHKSEANGVRLGIADEEGVAAAYRDLAALGPRVTVAAMAPPGVEVALGVIRDEQFGPLVLVAAGGTLVEVLRDRRLALPPVDAAGARRLLDGLAVGALLRGVRGSPPADVDALARAVARLSVLAQDLGDLVDAIDVNPVVAAPGGAVAVDALVFVRGA